MAAAYYVREGGKHMATLSDEVIINGMLLRNRIALPPLTTNYGNQEGGVTDEIIQFYGEIYLLLPVYLS